MLTRKRRKPTQAFNRAWQDIEDEIDIFVCVVLAEAKPDCAAREFFVSTQRANHR